MEKNIHIGGRKHVNPSSVIFLIADQNYTRIILKDGQQLYVATTLKTLQERLLSSGHFFRPNRGNLLNLDFMANFTHTSITMANKQTFKISRRRQTDFLDLVKK